MHYTIAYREHSRVDNTVSAMQDCADYLGDRYNEVVTIMRDAIPAHESLANKYRAVMLMCSLVGIQGYYPVRAMAAVVLMPSMQPMMLRGQAH